MFNYLNAKIYCIICNVTGLKFIGSTCRSLSERLTDHKTHFKKHKNKTACWAVLEKNDFVMILIQDYPCADNQQLLEREQYHIRNSVCVNIIPDPSQKKYYIKYYQDNVEKIRQQQASYYLKRKSTFKKNSL